MHDLAIEGAFLAIPAVPLLWAALALVPHTRGFAAATLALPVIPGLLAGLLLPDGAAAHTGAVLLGVDWRLDGTVRPLLVVTALVWAAGGWYARGYLRADPARWRFDAFYALTLAGNLG